MAHHGLKGRKTPRKNSQKGIAGRQTATAKKAKRLARKNGEESAKKPPAAAEAPAPLPQGKNMKKRKELARIEANLAKQHKDMYSGSERVLLVGEGNFSFARALCRVIGDGGNVFATAYDTEATLNTKYPDAAECRKEVEDKFGGTTLVGVDARRLHKVKEFQRAFHKIVWNFPHLGSGETDVEKNVADHRKLLGDFFTSALRCLDPEHNNASIHVALKDGEPYKSWKLGMVAQTVCPELQLRATVPFSVGAWPGYAHRRSLGFDERFSKSDNEELASGAKVYIFMRRK